VSISSPAPPRLRALMRGVNRQIAGLESEWPTRGFVCECDDRACTEAVEAPLSLFLLVESRSRLRLVSSGHEGAADRVVRAGGRWQVVVED
jgi:hypothetical protein